MFFVILNFIIEYIKISGVINKSNNSFFDKENYN